MLVFPRCTDAEHRAHMAAYQACKTPKAREDYARRWATRWSELSRLPYFDMCEMIAVDPMHNLFLGECTQDDYKSLLNSMNRSCKDSLLSYLGTTQDPSQAKGAAPSS